MNRRDIPVSQQRVVVIVTLLDSAVINRDLLPECRRHTVDDRSNDLMLRIRGIDDVFAYVHRYPNLLRSNRAVRTDRHLVDLSDIAHMTPIAGESHSRVRRQMVA